MKKAIYTFIIILFTAGNTFAQYCGNSGPSQCTASGTVTQPGLSPRSDSLTPFRNGIATATVIQFKNFNVVYFGGNPYTLQSLKIDSIENLPDGLCWATDRANNTYANSEDGCIKVTGTPCDAPGQYKLRIIASADIGFGPIQVNAANVGLHYFVRLGNYGDVVPPADTLQTAEFYNVGYSTTINCSPNLCPQFTFTESTSGNSSCATPNGTTAVGASGGVAPYMYYLGTDSAANGAFTGLSGGSYHVIAKDSAGCRDTLVVTVPSTTPVVSLTLVSVSPQSVCALSNGQLNVSANGGQATYTYSVNGNSNTNGMFSGLASGNYIVTVSDANSCSDTLGVTVGNIAPVVTLALVSSSAQTSCTANNGSLTVTSNGSAQTIYSLGTDTSSTGIFTPLAAGTYTVSALDTNGCTGSLNATVVDSIPVVTVSFTTTNASSSTAADGTATATVSGTASPSYSWNNGQATATATGLVTGTYTVTVTGANSCSASGTVSVGFTSGINDFGKDITELHIFPNPAGAHVTVNARLKGDRNVAIEIFNALGEKLLTRSTEQTDRITETFYLKGFSKGTYFVVLSCEGRRVAYPVVVE